MTTIRLATPDDAQAIAHVHVEAWRSAYRAILPAAHLDGLSEETRHDMWRGILAKVGTQAFTFVAEFEGEVVGFASGGPERELDPTFTGELYAIYLLDERRGQGIGTALFRKVVESLLDQDIKSMKVWVLKDNPYRGFYERHGGVVVEEGTIKIADLDLTKIAYGWKDLASLR